MYNYNVPEVNSLKAEIEELLKLCEKNDEESGAKDSYFEGPIEEEKMTKWEEENGVKIPESYKEWLRFSCKCRIMRNTATFWGPDEFHSKHVPNDLIVIGEMVGDGEVICFSKKTKKIVLMFEGKKEEKESFTEVLKRIINIKNDKPILSHNRYLEILAKIKAEKDVEVK